MMNQIPLLGIFCQRRSLSALAEIAALDFPNPIVPLQEEFLPDRSELALLPRSGVRCCSKESPHGRLPLKRVLRRCPAYASV